MKLILRQIAVTILACLYLPVEAAYYRWTDENGKIHYSFSVPADKSKLGHVALDKHGLEQKRVVSSKRKKQLKKIAELRNQQKIQDEEDNQKRKLQEVEDKLLFITYENEGELVRFYNSKIKMVEGNSKILEAQNEVLKKKIVKLEVKASSTEHDPTLKNITKKIVNIMKTIEQYKQAIDGNDTDLLQLSTNYQTDLAKYKELTK